LARQWRQRLDRAGRQLYSAFLFDLLHLDGELLAQMPVKERKERLRALLSNAGSPLHFSNHQIGRGRAFYDHACTLGAG
jgi:bifunctional non-homologous end joining protein LigD